MIVPCECGAKLKLDDAKIGEHEVRVRCPRCGNILTASRLVSQPVDSVRPAGMKDAATAERIKPHQAPFPPARQQEPLVLIAHDSDVVRDMVGGVLLDAGFRIEHASDGMEALEKASKQIPQAVILDVGIPGVYGFELCERLKSNAKTARIKIILLASVYGVTRYKRTPASLYGADDYIEKHHIADALVYKIHSLLQPDGSPEGSGAVAAAADEREPEFFSAGSMPASDKGNPAPGRPLSMSSEDAQRNTAEPAAEKSAKTSIDGPAIAPDSFSLEQSIFEKEECDIPKVEATDPEAVEKAKRFARIIVSDIALYNQEAVIEGVKKGTFFELLKDDIEEGRQLYENRVPQAIRSKRNYYQETIEAFIDAQKKIVR